MFLQYYERQYNLQNNFDIAKKFDHVSIVIWVEIVPLEINTLKNLPPLEFEPKRSHLTGA